MGDFSFVPNNSIFKNREALLEEWTPDDLVGRDEELSQYHAALQPVINKETPSNIFLYGTPLGRFFIGSLIHLPKSRFLRLIELDLVLKY